MVVKTITVTEDAYKALKMVKRDSESFSDTIKRIVNDKKTDISKFFGILSKEEGDELAKAIKENRKRFDRDAREREKFLEKQWNNK